MGNVQIPLVLIKTNDLIPVYEALNEVKRKIPARVLRYCKEQLFELVKSSEPERKLCVVDFDEIDNNEDVEFLVGVGVRKYVANNIGDVGYALSKLSTSSMTCSTKPESMILSKSWNSLSGTLAETQKTCPSSNIFGISGSTRPVHTKGRPASRQMGTEGTARFPSEAVRKWLPTPQRSQHGGDNQRPAQPRTPLTTSRI